MTLFKVKVSYGICYALASPISPGNSVAGRNQLFKSDRCELR